jgi:hypothetical protein
MHLTTQIVATGLVTAAVLGGFGAAAQHHKPSHNPRHAPATAHTAPVPGPFAFSVYGGFERMMQGQDFAPKAQLKTVMHGGTTDAVGAATALRGEITAIDGKLILTYGTPCATCGHPSDDSAALLITANVSAWHDPVKLPTDLTGKALDDFIITQAKKAGLDVSKPFPVRMTGTLTGVKMHVLRGPGRQSKGHGATHAAAHGSGHDGADQTDIAADSIEGAVVGFYAPPPLQGIVTHPGDPFHYHWVDTARTKTAHLDVFGMRAGAELMLPAR